RLRNRRGHQIGLTARGSRSSPVQKRCGGGERRHERGDEERRPRVPGRREEPPDGRASLQRPTRLATVPSAGFSRQGDAMTTLENRPNTAVLVIDVQNGVVGGAHARDAVVANVASVVEKARAADVPVVWVQHSSDNLAEGSEEWQIVPELSPDESEPLVPKRYPDSFEE